MMVLSAISPRPPCIHHLRVDARAYMVCVAGLLLAAKS
jgi:hypothetical protein